jgi:hypothetical protein
MASQRHISDEFLTNAALPATPGEKRLEDALLALARLLARQASAEHLTTAEPSPAKAAP